MVYISFSAGTTVVEFLGHKTFDHLDKFAAILEAGARKMTGQVTIALVVTVDWTNSTNQIICHPLCLTGRIHEFNHLGLQQLRQLLYLVIN